MAETKRLLVLGSTGSIGTQALDVCARSGSSSWSGCPQRARGRSSSSRRARTACGGSRSPTRDAAARAAEAWTDGAVLGGAEGLVRLVVESGADLVLNALVGSAGLGPTVATLGEGIDLALANKESLVVGGELVTALAEATGARIVPVDSEHTALHQLIAGAAARRGRAAHDHRQRRAVPRALARGARRGDASSRRSRTRRGRWAARSRSTPRR